jgi:hypothetical protein
MTAKESFIQDEAATKLLISVTRSPLFEKAVVYAKQQWMDGNKDFTAEQLKGVNAFLEVLRDLPIEEPKASAMPHPKVHHDIDNVERKPKPQRKK